MTYKSAVERQRHRCFIANRHCDEDTTEDGLPLRTSRDAQTLNVRGIREAVIPNLVISPNTEGDHSYFKLVAVLQSPRKSTAT